MEAEKDWFRNLLDQCEGDLEKAMASLNFLHKEKARLVKQHLLTSKYIELNKSVQSMREAIKKRAAHIKALESELTLAREVGLYKNLRKPVKN